jgi:SAM-dependent methyltransferase
LALNRWMDALQQRHMADLQFAEVARALRALSSSYVERRGGLRRGAALEGRGKRAAFALFFGPLHFIVVSRILQEVMVDPRESGADHRSETRVIDLGCGTGAAGAAWALARSSRPAVRGVDRHPWAVSEARWTYRVFGLRGRASRGDASRAPLPGHTAGVVLAYTTNELGGAARDVLLDRLLDASRRGARVLVVEPIAGAVTPWWPDWREAFVRAGGRSDEWRFAAGLPDLVRRLDRAAGLDHRELTAKSLWLEPRKRG